MAQIKRKKVSNQATKNVKKDKKAFYKFKRFWIILFSLIIVGVGIGVTIGLVRYFKSDDDSDDREALNYFGGESEVLTQKVNKELVDSANKNANMTYDSNYVPTFTKIGLEGVKLHANTEASDLDAYIDFMFIFATDLTAFYPDESIDDDIDDDDEELYSSVQYELFKQLTYFQYCIDQENARLEKEASDNNDKVDYKISLYIVDTSIDVNATIYNDSLITGIDTDETENAEGLFAFIKQGKIEKKYKKDNDIYCLAGSKSQLSTISSTCIPNAIDFMDNHFQTE